MLVRQLFTDLFLQDMLPALEVLIWNRYNRFPEQYSRIFQVKGSTRSIEQVTQVSGVGLFTQLGELEPVHYDNPVQGFHRTFTHLRFGLGFRASSELVDDDKFGLIQKMAIELGRSSKETIELDAVSDFNNGFNSSFPGPDGVCLFSASHQLVKAGGVQNNTLAVAADLDVVSLQLALTDYRKMKDSSGKKVRVPVKRLVVAPDNEWQASEILEGTDRSDTANRAVNTFRHRDAYPSFNSWMVWEYLTNPDAWFLTADPSDTDLYFWFRKKPYTVHDIDFDTQSSKTAMFYRESHGWGDFYGLYGSPGA
jgi:phage major head subunit gpT-like protein